MKPIWIRLGVLILVGGGIAAYIALSNNSPQPLTIEQCRKALESSTEFHKAIENMDEANRSAAYETGAMRCALDHDPETASWPVENKLAVISRAYCGKHADGNYVVQVFCEGLAEKEIQRYTEHGMEAVIIPKSIR